MFKAIETRFIGPTNTKGSRYKATDCDGNSVTLPTDYALDSEQNHRKVAEALRDKMNWQGRLLAGATRTGYAFVFADNK